MRVGIRSDERGISLFEISIITLIVFLIALSSFVIIRKINEQTQRNYEETQMPMRVKE